MSNVTSIIGKNAAANIFAGADARLRVIEAALSSIDDFVYAFDRQGRFAYVNKALLDLWGLKLEEAVGKNFFELQYPAELAATLQRQIEQVFVTGQGLSDETPYTSATGAGGVYEYRFAPVCAPDGTVEYVAGTTRDITQQHAAYVALQRSEDNFRTLAEQLRQSEERAINVVESIADGFMTIDRNWHITYINPRGAEMIAPLGKSSASVTGKNFWDEFPDLLGTIFETSYRRAVCDQVTVSFEAYYPALKIWADVRAYPSRDGLSLYFLDTTERKNASEEREQLLESERAARSEAERASRLKDEFLATLSHELRTPLGAILGWTYVLRSGKTSDEDLSKGLTVIERNARAQAQLIDDLLDMSRITSGKLRLDVRSLQPESFIEAAVETVMPAAEAKDIRIEKTLMPLTEPVSGDADRLQQVVWNLLSNAIKFTPRGGCVRVGMVCVGDNIEISIADSGQGIAADFLPNVFDRFRQADSSASRKHAGLGLGLSIVKQLVELHGGTVSVSSAGENQGATFTVALPLQGARKQVDSDQQMRLQTFGTPLAELVNLSLAGLEILVVDDEPDVREIIKLMLENCNAHVTSAASAVEALQMIQARRPDILVSDIGMADVDGYEFLRRVRALESGDDGHIPAVALTAFARSEDKTKALLAGYIAHVTKPTDPAELVATIAAIARQTNKWPAK
jgi:PAS domain S-box-containing protein